MGAFLGISLWVALATVVPGLVTIAALYGALTIAGYHLASAGFHDSDWVWSGVAVAVMVLTQAMGILWERFLIARRLLGPERRPLRILGGIDPHGTRHVLLRPYSEYAGLYLLLAELREGEDVQGHLQRALAQFFLTNNTMVSFMLGVGVSLGCVIADVAPQREPLLWWYTAALMACLLISYKVLCIRFEVMGKALWAARRRRLHGLQHGESSSEEGEDYPHF